MVDPQYWDIQPQKDNNNVLFNDLINVTPKPHPRTGMAHAENLIADYGDRERHWLTKRKGFKPVKLYRWKGDCSIVEEPETHEWRAGTFTDMTLFQWHRWFLRTNEHNTKLKIYLQRFVNPEECSNWAYYNITDGQVLDVTELVSDKWYIATNVCWYKKFINTHGLQWWSSYKEYKWEWWILRSITQANNTEWVLYNEDNNIYLDPEDAYIRLNDSGMIVQNGGRICADVASEFGIPSNAIFVVGAMSQQYFHAKYLDPCNNVRSVAQHHFDNHIEWGVTVSTKFWDTLSFCIEDMIYSISQHQQIANIWDPNNIAWCFDIKWYNLPWTSTRNIWTQTTWVTEYNGRLALLRDNWSLLIWGAGMNQWRFPAWDLSGGDPVVWIRTAPHDITDILSYNGYLVMLWPHCTYYFNPVGKGGQGDIVRITDSSWYFSRGSRAEKDGKIFVARSNNDLYILEGQSNYQWGVAWIWTYYTHWINKHIRPLNKVYDKINIDLTDNNTYVFIHDNSDIQRYSKILIQDRQYNFWYTWVIDGCRIEHYKHWVFFGDFIYSYEWDLDNGNTIKQIMSMTFGDETLNAPKKFINLKLAIGVDSKITDKSLVEMTVFSWGEALTERAWLYTTKYINQINNKDSTYCWEYDIGKKIKGIKREDDLNLQDEIQRYKTYSPKRKILDEFNTELAPYASIKMPINIPGEIIQIILTADDRDVIDFWGAFIWYVGVDYDFTDIGNTPVYEESITYAAEAVSATRESEIWEFVEVKTPHDHSING